MPEFYGTGAAKVCTEPDAFFRITPVTSVRAPLLCGHRPERRSTRTSSSAGEIQAECRGTIGNRLTAPRLPIQVAEVGATSQLRLKPLFRGLDKRFRLV